MKQSVLFIYFLLTVGFLLGACNAPPAPAAPTPVSPLEASTAAPQETPAPTPPTDGSQPPCLDPAAHPIQFSPRAAPLEVAWISSGNLWLWREDGPPAVRITATADALSFYLSPGEGPVVLTRGQANSQAEIWAVERDGADLRRLLSAEQLYDLLGEPTTREFPYRDEIVLFNWIEGGKRMGFEVLRSYAAIGGCCASGGYWQIDLSDGTLLPWTPPAEAALARQGTPSPDGRQVALSGETGLTLVNLDGSHRRENVLAYAAIPQSEGGGFIAPQMAWAADSQSLVAVVYNGDVYQTDVSFSAWRVPADGSPATKLADFSGLPFSAYLSPDLKYLAYVRMPEASSNQRELRLAALDSGEERVYAQMRLLEFWGWSPDGVRFTYGQFGEFAPQLGGVCAEPAALLDAAHTPARQFTWVDAQRFLYVRAGADSAQPELYLAQAGGETLLLGPFSGETAQYQIISK